VEFKIKKTNDVNNAGVTNLSLNSKREKKVAIKYNDNASKVMKG